MRAARVRTRHEALACASRLDEAQVKALERRLRYLRQLRPYGASSGQWTSASIPKALQLVVGSRIPFQALCRLCVVLGCNPSDPYAFLSLRDACVGASTCCHPEPAERVRLCFRFFDVAGARALDEAALKAMGACLRELRRSSRGTSDRQRTTSINSMAERELSSAFDGEDEAADEPEGERWNDLGTALFAHDPADPSLQEFAAQVLQCAGAEAEGAVGPDAFAAWALAPDGGLADSPLAPLLKALTLVGHAVFGVQPDTAAREKSLITDLELQSRVDAADYAATERKCYLIENGWWSEWSAGRLPRGAAIDNSALIKGGVPTVPSRPTCARRGSAASGSNGGTRA